MLSRIRDGLRSRGRKLIVGGSARGLAAAARLHPHANPSRHGVELISDVAYADSGSRDHLLDVYRPVNHSGPRPVVIYFHGGGFTQLSKDTHWVMGLAFARAGYLVFNVSYRLAPRHPYPAALEDVAAAYRWVLDNAGTYGGEFGRIIVAGESAGANLAMAVTVAACFRRPEPFAKLIFESDVVPRATIPMCGILQVSNPERLWQRRKLPRAVISVIGDVTDSYLGSAAADPIGGIELADPLLVLESDAVAERALPPMFASVGTRDPLLDDTRRLVAALEARGVRCNVAYEPGEAHAFQAFVWRAASRRNWRRTYAFLEHL